MKFVESHVHVWTISDHKFPAHPNINLQPEANATAEDLFVAQKDIEHVDCTILIQPRYYLWDNSYLAHTAATHPDRFVVAGRINPLCTEAPVQLRELMTWPSYRGIRLAPTESPETQWLDHHTQDALWEVAAETNATVGLLIHWYQLPQAEEMALRHPQVTIVIDHLGLPNYADPESLENLLALADRPNVYVKLSGYPHGTNAGYPYLRAHPFIKRVLRAFGASRVMWGSDWPVCLSNATYGETFQSAWDLEWLTDGDREWIFGQTARIAWCISDGS